MPEKKKGKDRFLNPNWKKTKASEQWSIFSLVIPRVRGAQTLVHGDLDSSTLYISLSVVCSPFILRLCILFTATIKRDDTKYDWVYKALKGKNHQQHRLHFTHTREILGAFTYFSVFFFLSFFLFYFTGNGEYVFLLLCFPSLFTVMALSSALCSTTRVYHRQTRLDYRTAIRRFVRRIENIKKNLCNIVHYI